MVKSVAAELEDEQGDSPTSSNVENFDVELEFVSRDSEAFTDFYIPSCNKKIVYLKITKKEQPM